MKVRILEKAPGVYVVDPNWEAIGRGLFRLVEAKPSGPGTAEKPSRGKPLRTEKIAPGLLSVVLEQFEPQSYVLIQHQRKFAPSPQPAPADRT